jgi:hypothetical protein
MNAVCPARRLRPEPQRSLGDELVSRFQFVADHRNTFVVKWLCEVVEIARSSFCAWDNAAQTRARPGRR